MVGFKAKKYVNILIILCLIFVSGCSSSQTLEEYSKDNKEFFSKTDQILKGSGLNGNVKIDKNDLIITIDISKSLKKVKITDELKKSLSNSFDKNFESETENLAKTVYEIEKDTKVKNVNLVVNITIKDEIIWSKSFNKNTE